MTGSIRFAVASLIVIITIVGFIYLPHLLAPKQSPVVITALPEDKAVAPFHNQVSEPPAPILSHKEIIQQLSEKACQMHLYWDIFETGKDVGTPDNWYALATPKGHFVLYDYQGGGPYWEAVNFPTQDEAAIALLKALDGPATAEPYKSSSRTEDKPQKPRRDIKGDPICRQEKAK